jgi:hypothetical protein
VVLLAWKAIFQLYSSANKKKPSNEQEIHNTENPNKGTKRNGKEHNLMWSVDFPASTVPVPVAEENTFDIFLLLSLEQILLMEGAMFLSCFDVYENISTS